MLSSVSKAFQEVVPLNFFKSKLLHQSGFYLVGQILQKAVSLLLLPVWTYYLTPADYGIMGTLAAYSGVLGVLLLFGVHAALTRHYFDFKTDHEAQRRYVTSNFLFMAAVPGVILAALILFGAPLWAHATASPIASDVIPFRPLVVLMLITVYGGLLYRLPYSLYQAQQKPWKCVALDFGGFVLSVGISLILVVGLRKGIYGMILGGCIASVLTALIATGLLLQEWFVPRVEWGHISRSLRYGLPFIPHLLAGWALAFVDRVMLKRMVPLDDVGRYTLAINLGMVMLMIVTSIKDAYEPYYYNLLSSGAHPDRKIIRIFSMYVTAIGLLGRFGSLFAGDLIMLLTPVRYHQSAIYVPPVIMGYLFLGYYFNVGMAIFYYKKTKLLPFITGFAAICNITLNYLLIPRFGAIAAAWNTYACYAIMFAVYYIIAQRVRRFPYPITKIVTLSALALLSVLVARSIPTLTLIGTLQKSGLCAAYLGAAYMLLFRGQSGNESGNSVKSES
jgi:O-antigen/teichoic acid export membrane protein